MHRLSATRFALPAVFLLAVALAVPAARADEGHGHDDDDGNHSPTLEELQEEHRGHQHGHDFEAMEEVAPEDMERIMDLVMDLGLALPPMDSHEGRELFVEKGCVICHAVNGVGGTVGPSLDAGDMPVPMNAFEFAARMWRGAPAMAAMQEGLLGEVISLDGQELADLIAFAHDEEEQAELTAEQIPERYRDLIME